MKLGIVIELAHHGKVGKVRPGSHSDFLDFRPSKRFLDFLSCLLITAMINIVPSPSMSYELINQCSDCEPLEASSV